MTALTGQNTGQIRVAGQGKILVAPVGTAAPVDTVSAWAVTWQDLGYTTEAGVVFHKADAYNPIKLWQTTAPGRMVAMSRDVTFKFFMTQLNSVTLPLWGGGNAVTGGAANEYNFTISSNMVAFERALGIEITDAGITYRFVIPRGIVTTTDDVTLSRTNAMELGITFTALPDSAGDPLVTVLMKDANLIP